MQHILVSDFDGTMTANDFYKLAAERLLSPDVLNFWNDYRAGRLTHFEALRRIFARINVPEAAMQAVADDLQPDPLLAKSVEMLHQAGWRVVVASAGCTWYIERVLLRAGLRQGPNGDLDVYANPGTYTASTGLVMDMPADPRFRCAETGVDKAAIVRHFQDRGHRVAFAGDGFADLTAALLTPPELRFARTDLAQALYDRDEAARPFNRWSDVALTLVASEVTP